MRASRAPRSRADGRARAIEIGRRAPGGRRATAAPRSSRRCPTTAASRRALIAAIVVDDGARSSTCPTPRSTGSGRRPAPRRRQGRRARGDPREAGRRSRRPSGGASSSTRASARSSSSRPPRSATRCRSSCTTTSASPATATRTGCAANEIPLGARIVAIADAYDAMIHDRPYKRAMPPRRGDRRAPAPRRDAVRPGARRRSSATCTRTGAAAGPDGPGHQQHAGPPGTQARAQDATGGRLVRDDGGRRSRAGRSRTDRRPDPGARRRTGAHPGPARDRDGLIARRWPAPARPSGGRRRPPP